MSRGCCGWWWAGTEGMDPDLALLWRAYARRFHLEHTFRFLKQMFGWTNPRLRHREQADRWTWLVVAAFTQLRLSRANVGDMRLPWERRYEEGRLTLTRVHRVVSTFWVKWGRPRSRHNPAGGLQGGP